MSVLAEPSKPVRRTQSNPPIPTRSRSRWLLLAAPVIFTIGYVLHPDLPVEIPATLEKLVDVRDRLLTAKVSVTAGALLWVPLLLTFRRLASGGRGSRLVNVGVWVAVVGTTFNALGQLTFGYLLWSASAPGVSRTAGTAVLEATNTQSLATVPLAFPLSIPLFSLGLLLLAIGLWRCGTTPKWATAALIVGVVLSAATGIGPAIIPGSLALTAAVIALLATPSPEPQAENAPV